MRKMTISAAVLTTLIGLPAPSWAEPIGQVTVLTGQVSGDYGTGSETDRQSATVRLTFGDQTRLRLDFDMLRVSSELGLAPTPLGPIPTHGRGPQGSGGPGSSGQGPTSGPGGPTPLPEPTTPAPTADEWTTGPGDLRMTLSRRLVGGGAKLFRLDAEIGAKIPTADETDRLGTGEWDYRLGVAAQYRFWSVTAFGGLGWNALGDPEWVELEDALDLYAGLESEPLAERVIVSGWLEANEEVALGTGSRSALGFGVRSTGKIRWRAQLTTGLGGSAEDFSALIGVSFGLSTPDIGSRRVG